MTLFKKQQIGKAKVVLKGNVAEDGEHIISSVNIDGDGSVAVHLLISALIDLLYSGEAREAGLTLNIIKKMLDEYDKDRKKENK